MHISMLWLTAYRLNCLLGSKELGTNVLRLQCVMLANHDQII